MGDNVVEVKSTNGDTHLGGDDVDHVLMDWLMAEFKKDTGLDVSKDKMVLQRLREAAEKAKIELSSAKETEVNLPFLTADASGPKHLNVKLTRAKFESLIEPIVERTLEPCRKALQDAGLKAADIDEVVLVGGSTRIPMVIEKVKAFFGKEPNRSVNPDEVVAIGAAVQGGVLAGTVKDVLLLDVTPLSLGIETLGGVNTVLIARNTTIPTSKSESFSTASDNQTSVEIHVLQGERPQARDNRTLGKFHLDGIPPAPRGVPKIEVKFDIDANGILNVSATDKASGKQQQITISGSSTLSEAEIQRMVKDAEAHAEEDKQRREEIEVRNQADSLAYQTEKSLRDLGEKIDSATKADIESKLAELKTAIEAGEIGAIKTAQEALLAASHKMAEAMYQEAGAAGDAAGAAGFAGGPDAGPSAGGAEPSGKKGKVVDAEFEEAN